MPISEALVTSVLGEIPASSLGITDAHNHIWLVPPSGTPPGAPVLNQYSEICLEMKAYCLAGGSAQVDCQPGGCGRDGLMLAALSRESGVAVIASTGFHRQIYYPPETWLWKASAEQAARHFIDEIQLALAETRDSPTPVRAGLIKVACEESLSHSSHTLLRGAALAALETGKPVEIHTEKGLDALNILDSFLKSGLKPTQIILCHMDKNPHLELHKEIAGSGALLEYDTFYRPKYNPEAGLWKLIPAMLEVGFQHNIALATDMAESSQWSRLGGGPGLASFPTLIRDRLAGMGLGASEIRNLMGANIIRSLAQSS